MLLLPDLLARRVRTDGASPLLTCYDLSGGARTELSATTFANWVAKTANLVVDELLLDPGDGVGLELATEHPGHWVTLVWVAACWQTGTVATLDRTAPVRAVVTGPTIPTPRDAAPGQGDVERVACSLHPLGLGFAAPLPRGVLDYALEVRGQPDVHAGAGVPADAPAWRDRDRTLRHADLVAGPVGVARRRVVRPTAPWPTVLDALLRPLRDGGSSVLVTGDVDPDRLARIAADERAELG